MLDKGIHAPFFDNLVEKAQRNNHIPSHFYEQHPVHRGLRNKNGTGVLVGLTEVGAVHGYSLVADIKVPDHGKLYYRGISLEDLVRGFQGDQRRGFEETAYLLLFGELPTKDQLQQFQNLLDICRSLPTDFTENMILRIPSQDIMNKLQRSVLVLYSSDNNPDDISVANVLWQSIQLIARFPTIISYGYQAKAHYFDQKSLFIHDPQPCIGTAENILYMIRRDNQYTKTEAEILDLCLVIHAEHGGGNNSAFATHVVSSSGTDTYSAICTAVGSLKGPKHGGANNRVKAMINDIKTYCPDWRDTKALKVYLNLILDKAAFDGEGLIYGMGHAVYTLSDPRAILLKEKAFELAKEKNAIETYDLYSNIEFLTVELFKERKGKDTVISANLDFYSGFVYEMLDIPPELYTPLFATARVAGWCAHRIEQIVSDNKIMRPAYMSVSPANEYKSLSNRD